MPTQTLRAARINYKQQPHESLIAVEVLSRQLVFGIERAV
jgi:hypothetical protein